MRNVLPARHPFRKLKSRFQIWPYHPEWDEWWLSELPVWPTNYAEPESDFVLDWSKPGHQYIGSSQMHDAPVHGIRWDSDGVEIGLTDYEAWRLSTALNGGRLDPQVTPFPVTLRFVEPVAVCAWVDTPMGDLWRLKHNLKGVLDSAFEFIEDRVIRWDDREFLGYFAMRYWSGREFVLSESKENGVVSRCVHQPELILGVHCRRVEFVEGQLAAMRTVFGERGARAYSLMDANRYLFSQGSFQPFVDLAERGVVPATKLP